MTHFTFSIKQTIKDSWSTFKRAPWFFVFLTFVMLIINVVTENDNFIISGLAVIATIAVGYIWTSVVLSAVDGKYELLQFNKLSHHFPTVKNFLYMIGIGLVTSIFILLGLVALIIPGLYIAARLMFANFAYVDRKGGVMDSVRFSWNLVRKDVFWKVVLVILTVIGLTIAGVVALGVGMFIAYPVTMLLTAKMYRSLVLYRAAPTAVQVEIKEDSIEN